MESPKIIGVREYGSLVVIYLATDEGRTLMVPLDEVSFRQLLEMEKCGPGELVGRCIDFGERMAEK